TGSTIGGDLSNVGSDSVKAGFGAGVNVVERADEDSSGEPPSSNRGSKSSIMDTMADLDRPCAGQIRCGLDQVRTNHPDPCKTGQIHHEKSAHVVVFGEEKKIEEDICGL
ncbi:hypothetical protein FRC19_008059, partial [Serendipita sp. 401]